MKINQLPSKQYLDECFLLVDGGLVWRTRPTWHFKSHRSFAMWNARFANSRAGRKMPLCEYKQVGIAGVRYLEHRVIAAMVGIPTDECIDHKDGCSINNDPINLRRATQTQNSRNTTGWRKKTLRVGVYLKRNGKFIAACRVDGKQIHLGTFDTYAAACDARAAAEDRYYGDFSAQYRGVMLDAQ